MLVSASPTLGKVIVHGNSFDYIPPVGLIGTDKVGYVISDGLTQSPGQVSISTYNSPPYFMKVDTQVHRNIRQEIPIIYGDPDPFSNLTLRFRYGLGKIELVDDPLDIDSPYDDGTTWRWTNQTWRFFYTPVPNEFYTDVVVVDISDGITSVSSTMIIRVVNFPPTTVPQSVDIPLNQKTVIAIQDHDPDGDPVQLVDVNPSSSKGGQVSITNGNIEYTPPPDYTGDDTIGYQVGDLQLDPTRSLTTSGSITVHVNPTPGGQNTNSAGAGVDGFHCHNSQFTLPMFTGRIALNVLTKDMGPLLKLMATKGSNQVTILQNKLVLQLGAPFQPFVFSYLVSNGQSYCSGTVTILFQNFDSFGDTLARNSEHHCHWRDRMRFEVPFDSECGVPILGRVTVNENVLDYTPRQLGTDSFEIVHKHGLFDSMGTVTLNVYNNPPIAKNYTLVTRLEQFSIKPLVDAIDHDPKDQNSLQIVNVTQPSNGAASIKGDTIYYQHRMGSNDTMQYLISDGMSTSKGYITIRFLGPNEIFFQYPASEAKLGVLLQNITGALQVGPRYGQLVYNSGWWYQSRSNFIGFDSCVINGYHVIIQVQ
jgi:hypothetical protein